MKPRHKRLAIIGGIVASVAVAAGLVVTRVAAEHDLRAIAARRHFAGALARCIAVGRKSPPRVVCLKFGPQCVAGVRHHANAAPVASLDIEHTLDHPKPLQFRLIFNSLKDVFRLGHGPTLQTMRTEYLMPPNNGAV